MTDTFCCSILFRLSKLQPVCLILHFFMQIYFLDTQVWYTVVSALLGGIEGARDKLGEVSHHSF